MGRRYKQITNISKYRMNRGLSAFEFAQRSGVAVATIYKLEKGEPVSRITAHRYLAGFNMDLTRPETWPDDWAILDREEKVVFSNKQ